MSEDITQTMELNFGGNDNICIKTTLVLNHASAEMFFFLQFIVYSYWMSLYRNMHVQFFILFPSLFVKFLSLHGAIIVFRLFAKKREKNQTPNKKKLPLHEQCICGLFVDTVLYLRAYLSNIFSFLEKVNIILGAPPITRKKNPIKSLHYKWLFSIEKTKLFFAPISFIWRLQLVALFRSNAKQTIEKPFEKWQNVAFSIHSFSSSFFLYRKSLL